MTASWGVVPCSLVDLDDVSEVLTASIIRAKIATVRTSVMYVCINESTRHVISGRRLLTPSR